MPSRTRAAPSYPKAFMTLTHEWIPWPILLAFYRSMVYAVLFSLCLFSIIEAFHKLFFLLNCTIPPTCCISAWPTMISVLIGCIQRNDKLLYRRSYAGSVYTWWLEKNRASFVSSPVNAQKHDTFRSNYTMSSVYFAGHGMHYWCYQTRSSSVGN